MTRPTAAQVDLGAISANVAWLRQLVAPAEVCAVVKADGYGHGALAAARAALAGGATHLAVALVEEGAVLRAGGIGAPILVLSEPADLELAVRHRLEPTVYRAEAIAAVHHLAVQGDRRLPVHLKVDTGMHRVGAPPEAVLDLARLVDRTLGVELASVWTHLAVADEPDHRFTATQLDRFDTVLASLREAGLEVPLVHAANSAGAIAHPRARYGMVRAGIATYGLAPSAALHARAAGLRPALSLRSAVSFVKVVPAGDALSYGLRHRFERDAVVATVPIGYADGVPRRFGAAGGQVLIRGRRRPVVGTVTMDQLMVDCGPPGDVDAAVERGDEVVLIGRQLDESVTADEWAEWLGTINYEVVCGISSRVPREYGS